MIDEGLVMDILPNYSCTGRAKAVITYRNRRHARAGKHDVKCPPFEPFYFRFGSALVVQGSEIT